MNYLHDHVMYKILSLERCLCPKLLQFLFIFIQGFDKSSYSGLKQSKGKAKTVNTQSALEIQRFYEKVMIAGGKQVRGEGQTLTPPTNYCQMLQEIAEVQRFEVQYFDIKDDSIVGKCS